MKYDTHLSWSLQLIEKLVDDIRIESVNSNHSFYGILDLCIRTREVVQRDDWGYFQCRPCTWHCYSIEIATTAILTTSEWLTFYCPVNFIAVHNRKMTLCCLKWKEVIVDDEWRLLSIYICSYRCWRWSSTCDEETQEKRDNIAVQNLTTTKKIIFIITVSQDQVHSTNWHLLKYWSSASSS